MGTGTCRSMSTANVRKGWAQQQHSKQTGPREVFQGLLQARSVSYVAGGIFCNRGFLLDHPSSIPSHEVFCNAPPQDYCHPEVLTLRHRKSRTILSSFSRISEVMKNCKISAGSSGRRADGTRSSALKLLQMQTALKGA